MTSTLRNAARGGLAAAGMLAGGAFFAALVALFVLPAVVGVAWYFGFIGFEGAVVVLLIVIAYSTGGGSE
jgi:putative effector of murein hydrolase LrgA (UPF0299 family)